MRLYGTSTGDGVIRISPVQNYRKEVMTEEVHYHSKSKGEDIPVSEMSEEIFAGTRNTEKGKDLFFSIEGILEEL